MRWPGGENTESAVPAFDACPVYAIRPSHSLGFEKEHHRMSDCIFCKIAAGQFATEFVYEDEEMVAFRDLNPQAPTHILIIPKRHIATSNDLRDEDAPLIGNMMLAAKRIAQQEGLAERGYRTVLNCNAEAGQSVFHIHLHLLGGRAMSWPPG
jgi:histidine triad (HIT) family protein